MQNVYIRRVNAIKLADNFRNYGKTDDFFDASDFSVRFSRYTRPRNGAQLKRIYIYKCRGKRTSSSSSRFENARATLTDTYPITYHFGSLVDETLVAHACTYGRARISATLVPWLPDRYKQSNNYGDKSTSRVRTTAVSNHFNPRKKAVDDIMATVNKTVLTFQEKIDEDFLFFLEHFKESYDALKSDCEKEICQVNIKHRTIYRLWRSTKRRLIPRPFSEMVGQTGRRNVHEYVRQTNAEHLFVPVGVEHER